MLLKILRGVQVCLAALLLVASIIIWRNNSVGQNILNLTTFIILLLGIDRLLLVYRFYVGTYSFAVPLTFVMLFLLIVSVFLEIKEGSHQSNILNAICLVTYIVLLVLNLTFIVLAVLTMLILFIRHIYRLMTDQLLTPSANL